MHSRCLLASLLLLASLPLAAQSTPPSASSNPPAASTANPIHLTAEQDRARLLALLHISESQMRRAPSPDARTSNATNYDESKANQYPSLPNPLIFDDGRPVRTPSEWQQRSREIRAAFDREILGRTPASLPAVRWHVIRTTVEKYGGVDVVVKRLWGQAGAEHNASAVLNIDLLLITPAHAPGPVPVLMELAFNKDFQEAVRGPIDAYVPGPWGVDGKPVLQRGWGFAILNPVSIQADSGDGLSGGIIGLVNQGRPRSLDDWGALKAWSWGASRALDYFQTDAAVDARQVGLAGHSRFGKAVLVAMAYDPRFAIAYSSSSGEGGAKLYRHIFGEQMSNLASPSLYHWFCGSFLRYGGPLNPGDLPIDNHELIALSAPRPIFIGGGSAGGDGYANPAGDAWADPRGMFLAEVAATPVYQLLGAQGLQTRDFPPIETALIDGNLAFRQHTGGHLAGPNWPAFLDFASHFLHAPQPRPVLAQNHPARSTKEPGTSSIDH